MTTEYLLHEQLEHVLAALTPQNELICRALLHTGLRISDLLTLRPGQIQHHVWITEAKTGKKRLIGFPEELRSAILAQSSKDWAFPSPKDPRKHKTRQAVWADLKRAAEAFRFPQNVAPHSLRKVYAVELMRKYGDIDRVRRTLHHNYQSTTMLYALADHLLSRKYSGLTRRPRVKYHLTSAPPCDNMVERERERSKLSWPEDFPPEMDKAAASLWCAEHPGYEMENPPTLTF